MAFHSVGGEWLSTNIETITTLFEYLEAHRSDLWIAPTGTIWKYEKERGALLKIVIGPRGILAPQFDKTKLEPFELYNVPQTMRTSVPATWAKAFVTIDGKGTELPVVDSVVQFEFLPQANSIRVTAK